MGDGINDTQNNESLDQWFSNAKIYFRLFFNKAMLFMLRGKENKFHNLARAASQSCSRVFNQAPDCILHIIENEIMQLSSRQKIIPIKLCNYLFFVSISLQIVYSIYFDKWRGS